MMAFGLAGETGVVGEEEGDGDRKCERASWVVRMGWVRLMSREA